MTRPAYELAQIVTDYKEDFLTLHKVSSHCFRTLGAIERCRTSALGGHVDKCDNLSCGKTHISYNSCRNRHCPKCQGGERDRWVEARQNDLLPCTYFHLVFTIPSELNAFCIYHPKELYNILFAASKETLQTFGGDNKHLGANMGMVSLLHTWGQNLSLHPHVHMIVPGGGFTDAGFWKSAKSEGNYLFPIKAMSIVYKNKFLEKLVAFLKQAGKPMDVLLRRKLYNTNWVVYAKQPFGGPKQVIEYIGRYSHKIAISNNRINKIGDGKVSFTYKDYSTGGVQKLMTLEASEFLRRFCMHILPKRFVKIRHYGFLASRNKPDLKKHQMQIGVLVEIQKNKTDKQGGGVAVSQNTYLCPYCKSGIMSRIMSFDANAPPEFYKIRIDTKVKV
jgi:Putative transposase/Transposase zinc-binding domain